MNAATAAHQASARAEACRLLSALFCEPDRATLLRENVPSRLERTLESLGSQGAESARKLSEALASADDEALRIEHARLFVGPGALPAAPYGSIYLEEGRQLMGASTVDVSALYEEAGLDLDGSQHELPDHIATELEYLHILAWREREALGHGDADAAGDAEAAAHAFVAQHLSRWVPAFAAEVRQHAREPFYGLLADVLDAYIAEERERNAA